MSTKKYLTVMEYINEQTEPNKVRLLELRKCILEVVPDAEELFNYGVPAFALVKSGKMNEQVMIAGFKNHVGFYPHPATIEHFASELAPYKQGKGSIQFSHQQVIPYALIVRMVQWRKEQLLLH